MKVLFISSGNNKYGISPIVKRQGESLLAEGIDLQFFPIKGRGFRGYLSNFGKIIEIISSFQPDIIHAHYSNSAYLALLASRKRKLITSFMGDDILGSRKSGGSISFISSLLAIFNNWLSFFFFDYNIVKSQEMYVKLITKKKKIIPNGVDIKNEFYPLSKDIAIDKVGFDSTLANIIFVSDPNRIEKNYTLAKNTVELLKSNGFNIQMHTIFNQTTDMLKYYYNASDLLLLTSFHEGSPNVIKEAMACNLPIVSTDVGDVKWVVGETKGCYLTTFDANDVADKIKSALNFSQQIGSTRGRERLQSLGLDSVSTAKRIIDIYKSILKK